MEFRSEAKSGNCLTMGVLLLAAIFAPAGLAEGHTYEVRHRHWHGGAPGTLNVSADGISYQERVKKNKTDSRQWRYEEIQQITVSPTELRILTYEDSKWELGRDREYVFDRLPQNLAAETYALWTGKLDQRFIAGVPEPASGAEWTAGAKLDQGLAGPVGTLTLGKDWVVFDAGKRGGSRSWRLMDIENISHTGPLDFTVTTAEKAGRFRGGMRDFHFQLQQRLPEDKYNALWREINRSRGLVFLDSQ
jgi:hypothetical protein